VTQSTVGDVRTAGSSSVGSVGAPTTQTSVSIVSSSPLSQQVGVSKEFRISAAHFLPFHKGKCRNLHGHNYRIRITLIGEVDPGSGMVKDFYDIEGDFIAIISIYDHQELNAYYPNPTAENLAVDWLRKLRALDLRYSRIIVWETDDCFAESYFK
jgi:6-pyruvoyltetrahydropterin/6-carboxytetrahydropterin synthase